MCKLYMEANDNAPQIDVWFDMDHKEYNLPLPNGETVIVDTTEEAMLWEARHNYGQDVQVTIHTD